ncbi:MAG: thiamine pyrophosphate-dependent enzyme [Geminicoccaceae bacterium]
MHLYADEEASAVSFCSHLGKRDTIASTHRGHGHCIAKGYDVRGMMLEIFGKRDGICGGKGGSMHIADLDAGMMGANGIVGGGPPLICGAALTAKTLQESGGVAIAFVGDGASNQGTTLKLQLRPRARSAGDLRGRGQAGYAEATASAWSVGSSQVGRAAGFGMPAYQVDGHDFFQIHEVAREVIERARSGGGRAGSCPVRPLFRPFRGRRHEDYRHSDEVVRLRADRDCLMLFRQRVVERPCSARRARRGRPGGGPDRSGHGRGQGATQPTEADLLTDVYVSYWAAPMAKKTYRQAINEALRQEMERDHRVVLLGEDIAGGMGAPGEDDAWGGARRHQGLMPKFGREQVIDTPISASAIIGAAVVLPPPELQAVAELMFVDFMGVCFDQIFNQAARFKYMFGGKAVTPVVIRTMYGAGFRATPRSTASASIPCSPTSPA